MAIAARVARRIVSFSVAAWPVCAGWLPAIRAAEPQRQPSSAAATSPAGRPTSAPSPQQLEQARGVFRRLMGGELTAADRARVQGLIARLGSDVFREREAAQEALGSESASALPLIRKAVDSNDAETAIRARALVESFEKAVPETHRLLPQAIAVRQSAGDVTVVGDLIALLSSDELLVRRAAHVALWRFTGESFGFAADGETETRAQAVRKARGWWEVNRARFRLGPDLYKVLDLGGGVSLELTLIPAGKFLMGSPGSETDRRGDEGPQREVTITKPFYMGLCEVTQEQYEQVMGENPSQFRGKTNPVEKVSWHDAVEFCGRLSEKTGQTVRLPTEAEWEYACRAGSRTAFSFGDDADRLGDYAWYATKSDRKTSDRTARPVARKKPNDFGLYDMHGNVWEWCSDRYGKDYYARAVKTDPAGPGSGSDRVLRGGGWDGLLLEFRSAARVSFGPEGRSYSVGFRVALDVR